MNVFQTVLCLWSRAKPPKPHIQIFVLSQGQTHAPRTTEAAVICACTSRRVYPVAAQLDWSSWVT